MQASAAAGSHSQFVRCLPGPDCAYAAHQRRAALPGSAGGLVKQRVGAVSTRGARAFARLCGRSTRGFDRALRGCGQHSPLPAGVGIAQR